MLQCVAVCCGVNTAHSFALRFAAAPGHSIVAGVCMCVGVCCIVVQGVTGCCKVFQCVAVSRTHTVLQYTAASRHSKLAGVCVSVCDEVSCRVL